MIKIKNFSNNYVWLLDNGHGGLINNEYQTKGKRSPVFPDGTILYEGVYNRIIVKKLINLLHGNCISYSNIVPENSDISLVERCRRANAIYSKIKKKCVYVSIHANAFSTSVNSGFNSANGIETFYYARENIFSQTGKSLAAVFQKHIINKTNRRNRGVKGANFYVLRETKMPSLLTESPFMTNYEEAKLMLTEEFQNKIAQGHFNAIMEIEKNKLLG